MGNPIGIVLVGVLNHSVLILTPRLSIKFAAKAKTIIITPGIKKAFHSSTELTPKKPNLKESII